MKKVKLEFINVINLIPGHSFLAVFFSMAIPALFGTELLIFKKVLMFHIATLNESSDQIYSSCLLAVHGRVLRNLNHAKFAKQEFIFVLY